MALHTAIVEEASKKATDLEKLPLIADVLARLRTGLPPSLTFHNAAHADDVLREAVLFGVMEKRSERELELLAIAAAYHDSGFLTKVDDHELLGAEMAQKAMEQSNYSKEEIQLVRTMILDTKLITTSTTIQRHATVPLSGCLLDADMSNFGRDDFFQRLEALCQEQNAVQADLFRQTLILMQHHGWFTNAAEQERQAKKEKNMLALKALLT